jgi:WD40 repeat protein
MRTFKLVSPASRYAPDVTRLWLASGLTRLGAIFGSGIRDNIVAGCWEGGSREALWTVDMCDRVENLPDPDFDRELTRAVYHIPTPNDEGPQADYLGLYSFSGCVETRLGTRHPHHCAFSPDGRYVLAIGTSEAPGRRELRRWPTAPARPANTGTETAVIEPEPEWAIRLPQRRGNVNVQLGAIVTTIAVCPDGRFAALGRHDGSVTVWNLATQRPVATIPEIKRAKYRHYSAHRLVFAPDGSRIAALRGRTMNGNYGLVASVWTIPGGEQQKGPKEKVSVNGATFSPDGQTLLTARADGSVGVWDTTTWKLRHEYAWKTGKLFSIAFAPDGLTCAAGGENGQVVIWDVDA